MGSNTDIKRYAITPALADAQQQMQDVARWLNVSNDPEIETEKELKDKYIYLFTNLKTGKALTVVKSKSSVDRYKKMDNVIQSSPESGKSYQQWRAIRVSGNSFRIYTDVFVKNQMCLDRRSSELSPERDNNAQIYTDTYLRVKEDDENQIVQVKYYGTGDNRTVSFCLEKEKYYLTAHGSVDGKFPNGTSSNNKVGDPGNVYWEINRGTVKDEQKWKFEEIGEWQDSFRNAVDTGELKNKPKHESCIRFAYSWSVDNTLLANGTYNYLPSAKSDADGLVQVFDNYLRKYVYVVAMGTYYTNPEKTDTYTKDEAVAVGQIFFIELENDHTFYVVVGDIKDDKHTNPVNMAAADVHDEDFANMYTTINGKPYCALEFWLDKRYACPDYSRYQKAAHETKINGGIIAGKTYQYGSNPKMAHRLKRIVKLPFHMFDDPDWWEEYRETQTYQNKHKARFHSTGDYYVPDTI